jgi:dipeptidyl aminopeptidase/acylaminoacyl peptidase
MMVKKLQRLNKDVEYIELEDGDHYLSLQKNRHDTFQAMERFLKTHLH